MGDYGNPVRPCGKSHPVCEECSEIRFKRIMANADKEPMTRIPTADWLRLVWLMAHTPELTAEQNAEVERIIASVNGGE